MPFYTTAKITLEPLTSLLAIYEGTRQYDLDSHVMVHRLRVKLFNSFTADIDTDFIIQLKNLITEEEQLHTQNTDNISDHLYNKLIVLLKKTQHELTPNSAVYLLAKRLSTLLQLNIVPEIIIEKTEFLATLQLLCESLLSRLAFERHIPIVGYLNILWRIYGIICNTHDHKNRQETQTFIMENAANLMTVETGHAELLTKCAEYAAAMSLPEVPRLYFVNDKKEFAYALVCPAPTDKVGVIVINNQYFNLFDEEEKYAVLAHELAHQKDYLFSYNLYLTYRIPSIIPIAATLISELASMILSEVAPDYKDTYQSALLHFFLITILVLLLQKFITHKSEYDADDEARNLAGPLAHASAIRTLQKINHSQKLFHRRPLLTTILEDIHVNDIFSSHPSHKKRL